MKSRETTCGLGPWRPKFMQAFASKKVYMFFYGVIGIIKGMQYTYLSAMLSTLERKFGIKSKETAYLMSGNEIAQILFLFFLPLTVKVKKRPFWCGIGMVFTSLGLYMMALPHFLTGYNQLDTMVSTDNSADLASQGMCGSNVHLNSLENACSEDGSRVVDWVGLGIVFLGVALTGIGNSLFWCFGMVYLDDNSGKENSPFMLSLTFVFRLVGPTFGYLLGAKCLTTYVYPGQEPDGIEEGDPRWIGAWWIGFPIIATLLLIFSLPLMLFPQRLPKTDTDASRNKKETDNLLSEAQKKERDAFLPALKRLLSNKLYVANFFSSIFYVFAFMGFGTFIPKYIEYQFRTRASRSSGIAGSAGTAAKAIGLLLSGWIVGKFKFSARTLSAWNVILGFCYFGCLIVFSIVGCPTSQMYGTMTDSGNYNVSMDCNLDCACPVSRMQPICSKDGVTNFYSPCHAGCLDSLDLDKVEMDDDWIPGNYTQEKTKGRKKKKNLVYQNCSCVATASRERNTSLSKDWIEKEILENFSHPPPQTIIDQTYSKWSDVPVDEATPGWCTVPGCKTNFMYWIIAMGVLSILSSTGRIGNVLVALRCVEVQDKSLSFAFQVVFMSLFAMLPSPIIFGAIIDNTCLLWQEECGETTNCLLYDTDMLRHYLMLTTAGIMALGVVFDMLVVYYAKDLQIFDEDDEQKIIQTKRGENILQVPGNNLMYGSHVSLTKDSIFKQ
eukprot:GFUD01040807.1.p1 GENE.GFUD01040807.1~~GFUD01040807.1.p1  ORF type:complete len:723 (+),score=131.38 GFUD01040807.1:150-2318(+)